MSNEPTYNVEDKPISPIQACALVEPRPEILNPKISGLKWVKEERTVKDSKVLKKVTLEANVSDIPDGSSVSFNIKKTMNEEGAEEEDVITLTGIVKDKMVQVEWETEDAPEEGGSE